MINTYQCYDCDTDSKSECLDPFHAYANTNRKVDVLVGEACKVCFIINTSFNLMSMNVNIFYAEF
jgi:hypothetical protein